MGEQKENILVKFDTFVTKAIDNGMVVNGDLHSEISAIREHILVQSMDGDFPKIIRVLYKMGRQLHGYISIFGGIYLATHGIVISTELVLLMSGPSALYIWAKGRGVGGNNT